LNSHSDVPKNDGAHDDKSSSAAFVGAVENANAKAPTVTGQLHGLNGFSGFQPSPQVLSQQTSRSSSPMLENRTPSPTSFRYPYYSDGRPSIFSAEPRSIRG